MYPIITISREFGSGGHEVARKVAEKLEIPFYDSNIVEKVASEIGCTEEYIKKQGEHMNRLNMLLSSYTSPMMYSEVPQNKVFLAQRQVILDAAAQGPCVIVGRCADYVLDDPDHNTLNVFIHSSMEDKVARIKANPDQYGEIPHDIEKAIRHKDKDRKTYYRYYTDREWGEYSNYQLNLDSGLLGIDFCADLIAETAKHLEK